jgi:hypothetical protein
MAVDMAAPEKGEKRCHKVCACAALEGSAERRKTVSDSTDTGKKSEMGEAARWARSVLRKHGSKKRS